MFQADSHVSKSRIVLVAGGLGLGGSTTFLVNFAGELIRRNVPVTVLSLEHGNPMAADFQKQHIPVRCWNDRRMIFEDRLAGVMEHLAGFEPTVVVTTLGATSFEALRYLPSGIFRVGMGQSHDPCVYDIMRHYAPFMDVCAMVSQTMQQQAQAMPEFARVPVAYLPYGVPMCPEPELPARDFNRPLRILYLGRLAQEQKRVRLFPKVWSQLCATGQPFHWTIAGEGAERGFLEANLKTASHRQTISFTGPVRYADVPALLREHDVFLLASDFEGLPLSLLEAMGLGLVPVVSALASGIGEVVDAGNGILVPVNEVEGYAKAIIHLHEHRDEMAAKSAAAHQRVWQDFSVAAMTDRWLAALPAAPTEMKPWPKHWRIHAPLAAKNPLYFSQPVRVLRRMAARLRN